MLRKIVGWFVKVFGGGSAPPSITGDPRVGRHCERCERPQVIHVTRVKHGKVAGEAHYCEECAQEALWIPAPQAARPATELAHGNREVPVEVETLIISEVSDNQLIIFREVDGVRRLSFALGVFEAMNVDRTIKGLTSPRPLTHDAWLDTIIALGAKVQAACVHDCQEGTYFTRLRLTDLQEIINVDLRPSDALIVTLKANAPFCFIERLLAENSVSEPEPA